MWESLVVNLGSMLSSLLGEEFLSAPIQSFLSGRLISPSQVKAIDLGTRDSSKTTMIVAGLDPK
jgi:hypothetical protein